MSCSSGPKIITEGLVFNLDHSNSKSYPAINDPYRNDVSLLLDFDEGFIDKSRNNTSFTTTGSPSITTNSKYGSGAGSFNGSNSYIEPSLNTTTSFGTGDFTIEGWIKPAGYSGTSVLVSTGMNGMAIYFSSGGILQFGKYGVATTISSNAAISTTSWTKFAITRSGTSLKLFLNDVLNASATDSLSYTGGSAMRIGFDAYSPTGNTKYNGLLQNLLIYEGFSKYN